MFERHFCFGIFYIENSIFVKQTGPCASKEEPLTLSTVPLWFWIVGSFKWIKYANKYANKPINKYFACTENETTNHCRGKKINDDEFEPFSVTRYGKNNLSWINIYVYRVCGTRKRSQKSIARGCANWFHYASYVCPLFITTMLLCTLWLSHFYHLRTMAACFNFVWLLSYWFCYSVCVIWIFNLEFRWSSSSAL